MLDKLGKDTRGVQGNALHKIQLLVRDSHFEP